MSDIPDGAIPMDQFEAATPPPVAAHAQPAMAPQPQQASGGLPPGAIPEEQFESQEDHYGTPTEMLKTAGEGAVEGLAGPLGTGILRTFGDQPEDMRARAETNPWIKGGANATALGVSSLYGVGEAGVMAKGAELAAGAAGLGEAGRIAEAAKVAGPLLPETLGYKVGSAAVKSAADMAIYQTGDEMSKMIMEDPDASAQTALSNIGMAAAFGGVGGAFLSGVVSPLWEATAGPKVSEMLTGIMNHANGTPLALPAERAAALETLGMDASPVTRAMLSGDPKAAELFNHLRESQHPEILEDLETMRKGTSDSVAKSLGLDPEKIADYDTAEAGHNVFDKFGNEIEEKYGPAIKGIEERNANAAPITTTDESRMGLYQKIFERGMSTFGTDSPLFMVYKDWGNRVLPKETIGALDSLKTEMGGEYDKAMRAGDTNMIKALGEVHGMIDDFQESQITKQAAQAEADGAEHGAAIGKDIIAQRQTANAGYTQVKGVMRDLAAHLGVPEFKGLNGTLNKLGEKMSPEDLLRKLSPKNNADIIPFLQKHFPDTAEALRQHEAGQIVRTAVTKAKGGDAINMNTLQAKVKDLMANKSSYVKWALPKEALEKMQAAQTLQNAIPNFKSSGTAGWIMKMVQHVPMSAMAMVGMMTGHNPVISGILGELAEKLGVNAPNAIKLAMLKAMGSTEPVSAQGFRSAVSSIAATAKGETTIARGTAALFKSGAQVFTSSQMPDQSDRDKIDKVVTNSQTNPNLLMNMANSPGGHYMPEHHQAMVQTTQRSLTYLATLQPKPTQNNPLDKPTPPSDMAQARYNRALDVAQQPAVVLQHIKDGTLQPTDVADLKAMYPALYSRISAKMMNHMAGAADNETSIPYHSKIAMSMFLGQPMDSSMTPNAIMGAQGIFQPTPPPGAGPQQAKGRPSAMKDKSSNAYKTATQEAESDRADRG